jgi:hypothetical protein
MATVWAGLAGSGFEDGIDAAVDLGDGHVYLFKGETYLRVDQGRQAVVGPAAPISGSWGGFEELGFAGPFDAALNYGNGKASFFRGASYVRYDIAGNAVDFASVEPIAPLWPGLGEAGFGSALDAAVNPGTGKVFFFKEDRYLAYDAALDRVVEGYPRPIAGNWPGLEEAGFGDDIDASWVALAAHAPPPSGHGLGPGDHVWYHAGRTSTDRRIPTAAWFPGSTLPTDYLGHGTEIFAFVVHKDGQVRRGRPHMRSFEGSYASLDNNPGLIRARPDAPDYGHYPGKLHGHDFLVFPSRALGYAAIATLLRGPTYRDLSIAQAFARYTPVTEGNDPVGSAQSVAAAAGVTTAALVRDLDDRQLGLMQDKIAEVSVEREGDILTRGDAGIPDEVRALLA